MKRFVSAAAAAVVLCVASQASAAEIVLNTSARGWIQSTPYNNGQSATNNYLVGHCDPFSCSNYGEYRDFFTFAIPTLPEDVLSAVLRLDTRDARLEQASTLAYRLTSTSGLSFASLGTGDIFGERIYSTADAHQVREITLTSAALAAIGAAEGATLTISGRVVSPTNFTSNSDQFIFGSVGPEPAVQLVLTTGQAVPEPATWALMIMGLGTAGAMLRRQPRLV